MTLLQLYTFSNTLNAFVSTSLGLFVFLKNPNSKINRLWVWMSLCIGIWSGLLALSFVSHDYIFILWIIRVANTSALFIPLLYLHFIAAYLNKSINLRPLYVINILLACTGWTPLFVITVAAKRCFPYYNTAGSVYFLFPLLYTVETFWAFYLLSKSIKDSTGVRRKTFSLILASGVVGFVFGATSFPLCYTDSFEPFGLHFVWLYCLFVTWAIFRYQLFDIHLIIRKSLIYSLLITLLTIGYFGVIYGVERLFQNSLGYRSLGISLTAFAVMAVAFQPLKTSIQRLVDWLVFRSTQEELGKRMELLEQQALQNEKLKAVSTMAAGMAHEIKNPLTILQTYAQFVTEKHTDPAFAKELQETLSTETRRIQGIVQDLLDFAKPKAPHMQPVDLAQLIQSTVNLFSGEFLKHEINCSVDCNFNSALLQADPDQMRQILINLIQNAIDATPSGGKISIEGSTHNKEVVLKISDTGKGIPKHLLPKIFDPFVTGKETGNGLGLTMVYSIVQAHHATIQVDSAPGQGTTFTVRLPTIEAD